MIQAAHFSFKHTSSDHVLARFGLLDNKEYGLFCLANGVNNRSKTDIPALATIRMMNKFWEEHFFELTKLSLVQMYTTQAERIDLLLKEVKEEYRDFNYPDPFSVSLLTICILGDWYFCFCSGDGEIDLCTDNEIFSAFNKPPGFYLGQESSRKSIVDHMYSSHGRIEHQEHFLMLSNGCKNNLKFEEKANSYYLNTDHSTAFLSERILNQDAKTPFDLICIDLF